MVYSKKELAEYLQKTYYNTLKEIKKKERKKKKKKL